MTISDRFTEAGAFHGKAAKPPSSAGESEVWDLPVRLCHWTLAAAFLGAFLTNRLGVSYFKYHVWCGYAVIVLVAFRILWGFAGTYHAQFRHFLCGPVTTLRYAAQLVRGRPRLYLGHNPLGAWMVVFLLGGLALQAVTGLFGNDDIFNTGPLVGYVSHDTSLRLTSLHRHLFYWLAAAVAVHVLAVAAHRLAGHAGLVGAMVTGRKQGWHREAAGRLSSSRIWRAILLAIAVAGALAFVVQHAPAPLDDIF